MAVRNTVVDTARLARPPSVVQAVWVSIVQVMAIAGRPTRTVIWMQKNVPTTPAWLIGLLR